MGKHKKEVDCGGCQGKKGQWGTNDSKRFWIPCVLCNGTGKQ